MHKVKNKNHLMKTDRLLAFSDGVLAIAITLLILEIKIPKHDDIVQAGGLYHYLYYIWPSYLSYVVSFLVIGIYWSNHHWLFTFMHKTNHIFNMIHIFFLMAVCFLPFSSAILGDYILDPVYKNAATTAYCVSFALPLIPLIILFLYGFHKHRLVPHNLNKKFMNRQLIKLLSGLGLTIVALAVSFYHPFPALCIIGLSILIYLLPPDVPIYDEEKTVDDVK
jgi:uncharacterized membrane protein